MTYEQVLNNFKVVRRSRDSAQCQCPAHNDKQASLTVTKGRSGVLVHCHAGCQLEEILTAAGLSKSDLFYDDRLKTSNWQSYVQAREKRKIEAVYNYVSFNGDYAFTKVRLEGKKIIYGKLANERFTYGLNGKSRKSYKAVYGDLKAVKKAIKEQQPIFLVEGERDVNTLVRRGYKATFTYGGVNDWQADFAEIVKDGKVYILADNDNPGRQVADRILADIKSVTASAKIIIPTPDIPKGDVTDYFQAGHTDEEFIQLLEDVTEEQEDDPVSLFTLDNYKEKSPDWLVSDYMPRYQITSLAGDGGSGKTTVWCSIVASISCGKRPFLLEGIVPDGFAEGCPEKVMFFSAEDSIEYTLKRRLRKNGADFNNIMALDVADDRFKDVKFSNPFLEQLIAQYRPALCVFDPIQAFVNPAIKMGDRNAMRNELAPLIGFGEKYGTSFLIVEHANKQSGVWGRKRIADSADIWDISRSVILAGETNEKGIRYLSHEKSNYGMTGDTVLYTIQDERVIFKGYSGKKDRDFVQEVNTYARQTPKKDEAKQFIIDTLQKNGGTMELSELEALATAAGITNHTIRNAKQELRNDSVISIKNTGFASNKKFTVFYNLYESDK